MKSFAEIDIEKNGDYLKLLSTISKLSGLFSENTIPLINYRIAENIFCRSFSANNLSRSDTAFDANYESIGIGIKTFISKSDSSTEKIAEFNQLSKFLKNLKEDELAFKLAEFRNDRITSAHRQYGLNSSLYHIVARREKELLLFETDYNKIDINNINSVKQTDKSLQFEDGQNSYSFNFSKSTLFRKFIIPKNAFRLPVEIIDNPYELLLELFENKELKPAFKKLIKGIDYVILPLYGIKNNEKFVFEKSGLNQWNGKPRPNQERRGFGEFYIPIPIKIHEKYPHFFPKREEIFNLQIPTGEIFNTKVCQENSKALMTNPNKALSDWLLRKVLGLKEGELATIEKLNKLGLDSVIIYKEDNGHYKIDKAILDSYEDFITN